MDEATAETLATRVLEVLIKDGFNAHSAQDSGSCGLSVGCQCHFKDEIGWYVSIGYAGKKEDAEPAMDEAYAHLESNFNILRGDILAYGVLSEK
jgi:hypothetical protein